MATADMTDGVPSARAAGRWSLLALVMFAGLAIAGHAAVAAESLGGDTVLGVQPNTRVFAGVGAMFVALTLVSHVPVLRVMSRSGAADPGAHAAGSPVTALLVSMSIRLLGTFLILAGLVSSAWVGRNEAVFDVLFWYVTLTTMEVVGIVWTSKSLAKSASAKFDPATKGV
ncbi:MAG: hypothetical protein ACO1RT_06385 [Planctomycetaceae bacterium]